MSLGGTGGGVASGVSSTETGTGGGGRLGLLGRALIGVLIADAKLSTVLVLDIVEIEGRVGTFSSCALVSIVRGCDCDAEAEELG